MIAVSRAEEQHECQQHAFLDWYQVFGKQVPETIAAGCAVVPENLNYRQQFQVCSLAAEVPEK